MPKERRPIPINSDGFDISVVEIIIDGKPSGYVVRGPDGAEYDAADMAEALGIIEGLKAEAFKNQDLKR